MENPIEGNRRSVLKATVGGAFVGIAGPTFSRQVAAQGGENKCVQVDLVEITQSGDIKNPVDSSNKYNDENRLISWLWGNWDEQLSPGEDLNNLPYDSQETSCTVKAVSDIAFSWNEPLNFGFARVELEVTGCSPGESIDLALVAYDAPCGSSAQNPGWNGSEQYVYSLRRQPNSTLETTPGRQSSSTLETTTQIWTVSAPSVPPVTNGLAVHLDAGRIKASDGEAVDTWPDISGNGNDAVAQASSPSFKLEPNDSGISLTSPAVKFDQANSESMTLGDGVVDTVDDATLLIVASVDNNDETYHFVRAENPNGDGGFGLEGRLNSNDRNEIWLHYGSNELDSNTDARPNAPFLRGIYSREGEDTFQNTRGKQADHTPYGSPGELYLGADSSGSASLNGNIREIIVYNRGLTESEVDLMEEYLRMKHLSQSPRQ